MPEGTYFDLFTGLRYSGGRKAARYRTLDNIPVLAKAGAVIPMTEASEALQNGAALPQALELCVYGGADGRHSLYEDDGETTAWQSGAFAVTEFAFTWRDAGASRFAWQTPPPKAFYQSGRAIRCRLSASGKTPRLPSCSTTGSKPTFPARMTAGCTA